MQVQMERGAEITPAMMAGAIKTMHGLAEFVARSGIEQPLLELVTLRASQLNGCAFCIDMHTKDARARGESEQRLYLLQAWREAPMYSDRERAALRWTEALTLVADGPLPDAVYDEARQVFTDDELVGLTMAVVAINGANRFNAAFRTVPGSYEPVG
jgi:AhpD family alkylhydroperoxidase